MDNINESEFAFNTFMDIIIHSCYEGTKKSFKHLLENGPTGREKHPKLTELHQWYKNLDDHSQAQVISIVSEAVNRSIYSFLVLLDNLSGKPERENISDFALYLQRYVNYEKMADNLPKEKIRINQPKITNSFFHDEFMYYLQDQGDI